MTEKLNFAFVRNEIIPYNQATLHISDLAIQRGYGIFDFLRIQEGKPFFMEHYLDRFYASGQKMELVIPVERHKLAAIIAELIVKNNLPVSGLKMILTGGYSIDGYTPTEPNLLIIQQPITLPDPEQVKKGIKIITHEYLREVPTAKTINYSMGIRLINKIKAAQASDVLYHSNGVVTEFPRANFFIVLPGNIVKTPDKDILAGITRKNVLEIAGRLFTAQTGNITLNEMLHAQEAFLTSTTKRIMPVIQIDNTKISNGKPGPVTLALLEALISLEKSQH